MRVLVISSYSESLVNFRGTLLKAFKDRGHEVFALGPDYRADIDEILTRWEVIYDTYFLERTGTNIFNDIKSYFSLKKKIRRIQPDLVFSYTIKPVIYGSLAAKSVGVKKIFALITGLGSAFNNDKNFKSRMVSGITDKLYKKALKNIGGVIFQNPDDREVFIERGLVSKEKTHRIYGSGVDVDYFYYTDPVTETVRFLFIGRLLKEKGITDFTEAAKIVKNKFPNTEFHVLGMIDSNPSSVSQEEVEQWVNKGLVKWHEWTEDVRPFIERASVFVLPSFREGTPRTALECMAMGRPLIMTDVPGCRETVKEGKNGYLVPAKDPGSIADAMKKFIHHPELIEQMGKQSRKFAEGTYDVHEVNRNILDILDLKW